MNDDEKTILALAQGRQVELQEDEAFELAKLEHYRKAQIVFDMLTDIPIDDDDERTLDEWEAKIDAAIKENIDGRSIYAFVGICSKEGGGWVRQNATLGALAKLAKDPKQKEKAQVRESWNLWQWRPDLYAGKAAFARDMLDKFESLKSQPVIEGWCRTWEKETTTKQAE